MSHELIKHATPETFDTLVTHNTKITLVDFWAEWCGPCKAIAPLLDKVAVDHQDKLDVVKVDVDTNKELAQKFGVRGIPTLLVVKGDKILATHVGTLSSKQLETLITSLA